MPSCPSPIWWLGRLFKLLPPETFITVLPSKSTGLILIKARIQVGGTATFESPVKSQLHFLAGLNIRSRAVAVLPSTVVVTVPAKCLSVVGAVKLAPDAVKPGSDSPIAKLSAGIFLMKRPLASKACKEYLSICRLPQSFHRGAVELKPLGNSAQLQRPSVLAC